MTTVVPYSPAQHEAFVVGTWLTSYAQSPHTKKLHRELYYAYQRALVAQLLERSVTMVAEDDGLLLGWACGERVGPHRIAGHYVFVKPRDHGLGIAGQLMDRVLEALGQTPSDRVVVTHEQRPFSVWTQRRGWRYEPRYLSTRNHDREAA